MRGVWKLALLLALAALLALGLGACGGDSGESSSSTAAAGQQSTKPSEGQGSASKGEKEKGPEGEAGSQGASGDSSSAAPAPSDEKSASFLTPGGDNSIQKYGVEANSRELEAAGAVLADFLAARAKSDWAGECVYLAKSTVVPLEELAKGSPRLNGKSCAAILESLSGNTAPSTRANSLTSDGVASLRARGDRGFVLYHGAHGVDYFVPMEKEGGEWKVGAIGPSEFP